MPDIPLVFLPHFHAALMGWGAIIPILPRREPRHKEGKKCFPLVGPRYEPKPLPPAGALFFSLHVCCACEHYESFYFLFIFLKTELATAGGGGDKNKAVHTVPSFSAPLTLKNAGISPS